MHPKVKERFHEIVRKSGLRPQRALEVGGYTSPKSLLRSPEIAATAERVCLNLIDQPDRDGIRAVTGNGNHMDMFEDECFDLVVTNATLEHDRHFWLTVAEMRRVLVPDGLLVIGVPGFLKSRGGKPRRGTITYDVHFAFDYYRFSEQAVREVFFAGMNDVVAFPILVPPRIIGHGRKAPAAG
jgi:SAM-dependent methyltransferase